jgi:hypothetical protein
MPSPCSIAVQLDGCGTSHRDCVPKGSWRAKQDPRVTASQIHGKWSAPFSPRCQPRSFDAALPRLDGASQSEYQLYDSSVLQNIRLLHSLEMLPYIYIIQSSSIDITISLGHLIINLPAFVHLVLNTCYSDLLMSCSQKKSIVIHA